MSEPRRAVERAQQILDKALHLQQPLAERNVERLRRVHPDHTPKEMISRLSRQYLLSVTASGAAAGAARITKGSRGQSKSGLGASKELTVPVALADAAFFTEVSVLYALSLAEVYALHPEDFERRRLLVLTVLLGDSAIGALDKAVTRTGSHWAKQIVQSVPMSAIDRANAVLGPRFVTKYGTTQGVLVLGKQVPKGVGLALGASGNHLVGRLTVRSARKIFGPPPTHWPDPQAAVDG